MNDKIQKQSISNAQLLNVLANGEQVHYTDSSPEGVTDTELLEYSLDGLLVLVDAYGMASEQINNTIKKLKERLGK